MGLFSAINIASSGMSAERVRLDVIGNNIANIDSTRTAEGGVFKRSRVVFEPIVENRQPFWKSPLLPESLKNRPGSGVRIASIEKDNMTETRMVWDPNHPDAIKSGPNAGMVEYPNVNLASEMTDMISASRAYEANAAIIEGAKDMFKRALDIVR